jgi:hypothetical protein
MSLRNLSLGLSSRPAPSPVEPAWDAKAHTVCTAFARVAELDALPRARGGKAGKAQVDARIEAKALARKLLAEWVAARGRDIDGGSTVEDLVTATEACKSERNVKARKC